jgi:hypothetical protein
VGTPSQAARGREGATGGGAKLLERADMSGVSSNFVKKFVWGS